MKELTARLNQVRQRVTERSPLDADETARIARKHFGTVRPIVEYLWTRYGFGQRRVLEIGSSYGDHLLFWGEGSEGIELQERQSGFTSALGFPTHRLNVEDELGTLPAGSYDAIHTNNLLEHLVAPHLFLARCHHLLRDDGLLVVGHPVVPSAASRWAWSAMGYGGWLAGEHINFFTPETVRLTLERAGFQVLEQLSPGFLRINRAASRLALPVGVGCYSICRKRLHYRYSQKRLAAFDPAYCRDELAAFRDRLAAD